MSEMRRAGLAVLLCVPSTLSQLIVNMLTTHLSQILPKPAHEHPRIQVLDACLDASPAGVSSAKGTTAAARVPSQSQAHTRVICSDKTCCIFRLHLVTRSPLLPSSAVLPVVVFALSIAYSSWHAGSTSARCVPSPLLFDIPFTLLHSGFPLSITRLIARLDRMVGLYTLLASQLVPR